MAQIFPTKHHAPPSRVIEAQQQVEQRRFAGPAWPDEGHTLAAAHLEINLADGWPAHPGRVGEIDGFEAAGDIGITAKRRRRRRLGKAVGCLQCLGNALGSAGRPLQLARKLGQETGRGRDEKGIEDE